MDKLELKHIKGYLDHNLRYYLPLTSERFESILENECYGIIDLGWAIENNYPRALDYLKMTFTQPNPFIAAEDNELFLGQMKSSLGWEEDDVYLREMMPVLRPLSDLTKQIEHNGEKIIPIVELAKLTHIKENHIAEISQSVKGTCDGVKYSFGFYNGSFWMKRLRGTKWVDNAVFNQDQLFDKLNEYHFDWKYELIKKGLAKDINTL